MPTVTVRLLGGLAVPLPTRTIRVEVSPGATVRELVLRLEREIGVDDLAERLDAHCLVAVDGTEVGHLGGWDVQLSDGAVVSIVPAMVGGRS
jgi:molybdopterin converting factor small subunit